MLDPRPGPISLETPESSERKLHHIATSRRHFGALAAAALADLMLLSCEAPQAPAASPTVAPTLAKTSALCQSLPTTSTQPNSALATQASSVLATAPACGPNVQPTVAPSGTPVAQLTLVVEEHPIVAIGVDTPSHFEYNQRIAPTILERRAAWRDRSSVHQVEAVNTVIERFGLRLISSEKPGCPVCAVYRLQRGDEILFDKIDLFRQPAINALGDDFAFYVEGDRANGSIVSRQGLQPYDMTRHGFTAPVFAGNDLVSVEASDFTHVSVERAGKVVYSTDVPEQGIDNPVKGLWAWQGNWVLEVKGEVIIDGKSHNRERGHDEIFGWRMLGGEPFYFFRRQSEIGIHYAAKDLLNRYSEVIHYKCCEPAAFNVQGNDRAVWFHALRGETWQYVEAVLLDGADLVWESLGKEVSGVSPVLRPAVRPSELETVLVLSSGPGGYQVEYSSPGKRLMVGAGAFNPPLVSASGESKKIKVRGQDVTLQIQNKARPNEAVQLYWEESGRWEPAPGSPVRDKVFYLISSNGVEPEEVVRVAESLEPLGMSFLASARPAGGAIPAASKRQF